MFEESKNLTEFGTMLRELRRSRGVTHRQVASAAGLAPQTSSNCEAMAHKVCKRDKVERIAAFYGLDTAHREKLLAAWEALPQSAYNQRQAKTWSERNQARSKVRHHDAMQVCLVEVLSLLVTSSEHPCTCTDEDAFNGTPGRTCEVCTALAIIGYPTRYNGLDPVIAFLAEMQERLAPAP